MKIQHVKKAPLVEKKISVKLINFYPVQIKFQSEKKRTVRTATIRRQLRFDPASLLDSFVVDSGHLVIRQAIFGYNFKIWDIKIRTPKQSNQDNYDSTQQKFRTLRSIRPPFDPFFCLIVAVLKVVKYILFPMLWACS